MIRPFIVCFVAATLPSVAGADTDWYEKPFKIQAGGRALDTAPADTGGHAAPFLADIDGDGKRDLVVGSIVGTFQLFRNIGTDSAPRFGSGVDYLLSGDHPASVPGFCCVAAGAQMVDIDNDGVLDLTSGSYFPGALYWFKGLGAGRYSQRSMLTDAEGRPLFPHPESVYDEEKKHFSYVSNLAWVDWDSDGMLDIVMGSLMGELRVRKQTEGIRHVSMPIRSQPVFEPYMFQHEIKIDGAKAVTGAHSAPGVADWDGDGLFDLIVGTAQGSVFLLRNTGSQGAPVFKSREVLLEGGEENQWLDAGDTAQRGVRSQIHAVDYNLDGKIDLLVGDWFLSSHPRTDLSARERKKMLAVRAQLAEADKQVGNNGPKDRMADMDAYRLRFEPLEKQLAPYLQTARTEDYVSTLFAHGTVWVFLRK